MPSKPPTPTADGAHATAPSTLQSDPRDARSRAAAKGAATVRRHKDERRADLLAQMREQIATGNLVVRQMPITPSSAPDDAYPSEPDRR